MNANTQTNAQPESTPSNMLMLVRRDLFHQDAYVVDRTLYYLCVLSLTQRNDEECDMCDEFVSVRGCFAIVVFLRKHLKTCSNCDQIALESALEKNRMMCAKWRLYRALLLIMTVAYKNKDRGNVFAGSGAIEATIAVMEALPLYVRIQGAGCCSAQLECSYRGESRGRQSDAGSHRCYTSALNKRKCLLLCLQCTI